VAPALLPAADHDTLAEALEAGVSVVLGVVPSVDPPAPPEEGQVAEQVLRWLDMLGLAPGDVGDRLAVSPTCGLAGASYAWARQALATLRGAATQLR
jgi:methionine synthase II (cobalamin-independent)